MVQNVQRNSGSIAVFTTPCKALSYIVGIPKGCFSSLPGFGIHTLRVGFDLQVNLRFKASSILCFGLSFLIPSTPAVLLPLLSTVARVTAVEGISEKVKLGPFHN